MRIGNWVAIPECGIIAQVDIIGEKKACINVNPVDLDKNQNDFYLTSFEGVALSTQILTDCGFIHNQPCEHEPWNNYTLEAYFFNFDINVDNEGYFYILFNYGMVKFKYLHQLQNLYFALTGKELQLNQK